MFGLCDAKDSIYRQIVHPDKRRAFSDKVKIPLRKAILFFASKYPTPTRENLFSPNSHLLLDIRDEFMSHENNATRGPMLEAMFNIFIAEYDHDIYYRRRIDYIIEQIIARDWKSLDGPPGAHPYAKCWKTDEPPQLLPGRFMLKLERK